MGYRLEQGESVASGVQRVVREQLELAIAEVGDARSSPHERVHLLRKRCKKLRSVARLARPALGDRRREINVFYRDLARPFSSLRDAHALVESFDEVMAAQDDVVGAGAYAPVRSALVARRDDLAAATDLEAMLGRARDDLATGLADLDAWRLEVHGFPALAGGIERTQARGRKALAAAGRDPSAEVWHRWRKRAKDLWYHLRLLWPLWPGPMEAFAAEADHLASILGDEHDTHVLADVGAADPRVGAAAGLAGYLHLLHERRARLRAAALPLGARLFAEPPRCLVARLEAYEQAGAGLAR